MRPAIYVYIINVDWYFNLHWLERARAVKNLGHTVHIIMTLSDSEIYASLKQEGFICHEWRVNRKSINPLSNFRQFQQLSRLLLQIAPDLIHAITIKPNIFMGLLSYRIKIPYILSVTGTGIIFSGQSLTLRLIRPFIRLLYKIPKFSGVARKFIFENPEDQEYFVNTGLCSASEAVTILGAGVDLSRFQALPADSNTTPNILFAARLLWDKGLGDLVAAAKILRDKGLDFNLWVAGIIDQDTVSAIPLRQIESWHARGEIIWLGTESNMPELLAKSHVVVLPTFYGEGIPRILIEAAACSRALVASNIAGCREIVKDGYNGLLVTPQEIKELAEAMEYFINNPQMRSQMGVNGRQLVEQQFSEQQVISETLAIYDGLSV